MAKQANEANYPREVEVRLHPYDQPGMMGKMMCAPTNKTVMSWPLPGPYESELMNIAKCTTYLMGTKEFDDAKEHGWGTTEEQKRHKSTNKKDAVSKMGSTLKMGSIGAYGTHGDFVNAKPIITETW